MSNELPNSPDAERAVIGSVLMNREALIPIVSWLKSEDFYAERHGLIYAAMVACYQKRIPPDLRTVIEHLRDQKQLDAAGGVAYLSDLLDAVPTSYHVEHYARIVERHAIRRALISAGGKIAALGYDTTREIDDVLTEAQAILTQATRRQGNGGLQPVGDVASRVLDAMLHGIKSGKSTGLYDFDALTGGVHPGTLIVLGGRPGNGKSALAATMAANLAETGPVLFFSLEMTQDELTQRLIAMRSGVDLLLLRRHALNEAALQSVVDAMGPITDMPIRIDDTPALTMADIRSRTLQFINEHDTPALIVVDYLQLVHTPIQRGENRAAAVGAVSRGLKALAKEARCPVLALAQLNRDVDRRGGDVPVPELADLRESGDIEADADIVAFVVRPELYDQNTDAKGTAQLYIKKHRGGPVGTISLRFQASTTRFDNLRRGREVAL